MSKNGGTGGTDEMRPKSERRQNSRFCIRRAITAAATSLSYREESVVEISGGKCPLLQEGRRAVPQAREGEMSREMGTWGGRQGEPEKSPSEGKASRGRRAYAGAGREASFLQGPVQRSHCGGLGAPSPGAEGGGRERRTLTFSSSDTRSSTSAILGGSGPARPRRGAGREGSRGTA